MISLNRLSCRLNMPTKKNEKDLLLILEKRFLNHMHRHPDVSWQEVEYALSANAGKIPALQFMEETGGEPDILAISDDFKELKFADFSEQSPSGRRSLCYDAKAMASRKDIVPANNVIDMANAAGVSLMDEKTYRLMQSLEPLDTKTSSWLLTPKNIRDLGGAIFGDNRYKHVFIYHNGAQSFYAARGFRATLVL